MAEEAVETPLASLARVVSKATAQFFLPPLSLTAFFAGKIFSVVWRFENLGNPRARKKPSYSRVSLDSFGENDFFPGQIFGHTRTDLARRPIPSSFPSPFSITWSRQREGALTRIPE